jgi:uncharacterized protein (DUF305 family)
MDARHWCLAGSLPLLVVVLARADSALHEDPMAMETATNSHLFAADNARAMDRMMAAMSTKTTGDTDRDFVATMVPHHQGAIDMALAELRFGKDETLRRMAQEIIVEQKQEIAAMQLAASRLPGPKSAGPASSDTCKGRSAT